nr:unnamed protein product [Spirometra erinaceieuropaei]
MSADDMMIWSVIWGPADEDRLQVNLKRLQEWSDRWLLRFMVGKCSTVRLGNTARSASTRDCFLGGAALQEVEAQKGLGVHTTNSPKPSVDCSGVAKSSMSVPYAIKRAFIDFDEDAFSKTFGTFVQPHLEYGIQAWRPLAVEDQNYPELAPDSGLFCQIRALYIVLAVHCEIELPILPSPYKTSSVSFKISCQNSGQGTETIRREVLSILNKVTAENFTSLSQHILNIHVESPEALDLIVQLTFKIRLLKRCEDEFTKKDKIDPSDSSARRRYLGGVRFIAELGRIGTIPEKV